MKAIKRERRANARPALSSRPRRAWVLLARVPVRAPVSAIVRFEDEPTQENELARREAGT